MSALPAQAIAHDEVELSPHPVLNAARAQAHAEGLTFAGSINPADAWALIQQGAAQLVDVRTAEERKFVGLVPDSVHVAWMTGSSMTRNPRFLRELELRLGGKHAVALLLCRSGKRSAAAAEAAARAGFTGVFNVSEGFEGELDTAQRRGTTGGWRFRGLPWEQE